MGARDGPSGWIGEVLQNKWRIDARIARGGVATVFRATHRLGQVAAIKIMHPQYARNADARARFLREGYAANAVGHPGAVCVLDNDVTEDGSPYIVMELLQDGELLEERRARLGGTLPYREIVGICDQVLDILEAAHEKGIVHRDIKPDNIFLLADGTVKLLDFGIAHMKEAVLKHEATATGLLLGTPEFMAPEQALGTRGQIDAATDIFSLGAMMFMLVSGQAVHVEGMVAVLLLAISTRQARSLASTGAVVPPALIAVIDRPLALGKPRRWPSARAMQTALRAAVPDAAAPGERAFASAAADEATAPRTSLSDWAPASSQTIVTSAPDSAASSLPPSSDQTAITSAPSMQELSPAERPFDNCPTPRKHVFAATMASASSHDRGLEPGSAPPPNIFEGDTIPQRRPLDPGACDGRFFRAPSAGRGDDGTGAAPAAHPNAKTAARVRRNRSPPADAPRDVRPPQQNQNRTVPPPFLPSASPPPLPRTRTAEIPATVKLAIAVLGIILCACVLIGRYLLLR